MFALAAFASATFTPGVAQPRAVLTRSASNVGGIALVCSAGGRPEPAYSCTTRRNAVLAAAAVSIGRLASAARAYDSIPSVETDFGAAERARKEREVLGQQNQVKLDPYIKKLNSASTGKDFEAAADDLSLYVIGCPRADPKGTSSRKACLDGVPIKEIVGRIREDYDTLPLFYFKCPKGQERRDGTLCRSPGLSVEDSFQALMKELRKGTVIQTGDFRRVELNQF